MTPQPSKSLFSEILVGILVTIVGGVLLAWYLGEGHRFQSNQSDIVSVKLTSHYCNSQDFLVDGERVATSIEPNTTVVFKTTSGEHWIYYCSPTTNDCGESTLVNWDKATSYTIEVDSRCPIAITVTNMDCSASDYYVGGNLVASNIPPNGGMASFEIRPGEYEVFATDAGVPPSDQINEVTTVVNFSEPGERTIGRRESCP
jgi:hypothetical protein